MRRPIRWVALGALTVTVLASCSDATTTQPASPTAGKTVVSPAPAATPSPSPVSASPPAGVTGANAAAGAETSAIACPDVSDGIIWGSDEALRLLVMGAGNDHAAEVGAAADTWADERGVEVTTSNLSLYGAPVLGREIAGRIAGDPPPDAVEGFVGGMLVACAGQGRLTDLTELWADEGLHGVIPASVADLATVDGRRWFVPTTVQWNALWYRPDVFDDLGLEPAATWDDLLAACASLADAGMTPFSLGIATWQPPVARWFSHLDLALNGPDFHERLLAGLESWDDARVAAVFDHWEELLDRGCFGDEVRTVTYQEAIDAVVDGDAGLIDLGSWIHESLDPADSVTLRPAGFPVLDESLPRTEIATVQGAFVPAGGTRPDQAMDLVATLAGPDRLVASQQALGRTVVREDVEPGDWPWAATERRAIADADRVVQLLEFTAEDRYAGAILGALATFVADPATRSSALERLESTRRDVFG